MAKRQMPRAFNNVDRPLVYLCRQGQQDLHILHVAKRHSDQGRGGQAARGVYRLHRGGERGRGEQVCRARPKAFHRASRRCRLFALDRNVPCDNAAPQGTTSPHPVHIHVASRLYPASRCDLAVVRPYQRLAAALSWRCPEDKAERDAWVLGFLSLGASTYVPPEPKEVTEQIAEGASVVRCASRLG